MFREDYDESGLPSHPCLKLVANSEQILTKIISRRLLTFEKVRHLNPSDAPEVHSINQKISDFRGKYYEAREETRKERRLKEAQLRKENWIKSGKNLPNKQS